MTPMNVAAGLPMHANAPEARRPPLMPPFGTFRTPNGFLSGLWALPRPLTRHWGQGEELMQRIAATLGEPDIIFGKQDTSHGFTVDMDPATEPSVIADWSAMPFEDQQFRFGYWDPPYLGRIGEDGDVHYDRMDACLREICRVLEQRLVILSPLIYPCPKGWVREAVIAATMGPNKVIRAVQSFVRDQQVSLFGEPGEDALNGVVINDESLVDEAPIDQSTTDDGVFIGPGDADPPFGGTARVNLPSDSDGAMASEQGSPRPRSHLSHGKGGGGGGASDGLGRGRIGQSEPGAGAVGGGHDFLALELLRDPLGSLLGGVSDQVAPIAQRQLDGDAGLERDLNGLPLGHDVPPSSRDSATVSPSPKKVKRYA